MTEGDRASVHAVIVHHRGCDMLRRCLESLLASRDVELEVVTVANHCQEALPDLVERSDRIHLVVSEDSRGFSAANNLGVDWARRHLGEPDFYYFVNNDTESAPTALARLVRAVRSDPDAAVAGPRLLILGAPEYLNSLGLQVTEDAWGWDEGIGRRAADYGPLPDERPMLAVTGSALLIKAPVYRLIGGWDEVYDFYFEDIDLCIKVWEAGCRVLLAPDAVVRHQISATMTEDAAGTERKHFLFWRNRLMLALVHWPRPLLWKLLKRVLVDEIARPSWAESRLARRALAGASRRLPALLRRRWGLERRYRWSRFLHPAGSVPTITLPAVNAAAPPEPPRTETEPAPPDGPSARLEQANRRIADLEQALARTRHELREIHRSRMWRWWMRYLAVRRALLAPFKRHG